MLPENYEPKRLHVIISVIILSGFAIYAITTIKEEEEAFSSGVRYTIGVTTEIYFTTSGRAVNYEYEIEGAKYFGSTKYGYNCDVPGRYWLKFSVDKPNISRIYLDKPVPISIQSVPPEGIVSIN